jgi:hypothetical protein
VELANSLPDKDVTGFFGDYGLKVDEYRGVICRVQQSFGSLPEGTFLFLPKSENFCPVWQQSFEMAVVSGIIIFIIKPCI